MHSDLAPSAPDASARSVFELIERTLVNVFAGSSQAEQSVLLSHVVGDWRNGGGGRKPKPILSLVAGYAGSGKSEFSQFLSTVTGWALLDKDTLTGAMAERLLTSLGGDPHDRHTDLYVREVRPLEYQCLMESAFDNLRAGTSVILTAPFVGELADPEWMSSLNRRCAAMGIDVAVIWMRCDVESMRTHIERRGAARDAWKLANWDAYARSLDADNGPTTAHVAIDNRRGIAINLIRQARESLKSVRGVRSACP